jgi:hypothetical protein
MSENETIDDSAEFSWCHVMSSYLYQEGHTPAFSANRDSSSPLKTPSGTFALGIDAMAKWLSPSRISTANAKENDRPLSSSSVSKRTMSDHKGLDGMEKWLSHSITSIPNAKENEGSLSLPSVSTITMTNQQHPSSTKARDAEPSNNRSSSTRAHDKIRSHKKFQRYLERSSKKKSSLQTQSHARAQNAENDRAVAASKLWYDGQQQQENIFQAKSPRKSFRGSGSDRRQPLQDITRTVLDQECSGRQQPEDSSETPELERAIIASKFCSADGSRLLQKEDTSQSKFDRVIAASKLYTSTDSRYSQSKRDRMMQNPKLETFGGGDTNYSRAECHLEYGIPNAMQAPPGGSIKQKGALRQILYGSSSNTSSVFAKDIFGEISNTTMDSKLQSAREEKQGVTMDTIRQSARKQKQESALLQLVRGHVYGGLEDRSTAEDTSCYPDPPIDHYLSSPEIESQQVKSNGQSSRKDSQTSDSPIAMYQSSPDSRPLGRQSNLRDYRKKAQQVGASGTEEESQYCDPPIELYQFSPDSTQPSDPYPTILNVRLHSQPNPRSRSGKKPCDSHPSSDSFMYSPEKQPLKRGSYLGDYTLQPNESISPQVDSFPKDTLKSGHHPKSDLNEGFCPNTSGAVLEKHLAVAVTPSPRRWTRSEQVEPAIPSAEITVDARLNSRSQSMPPQVVYNMQASPAISCLTTPYTPAPSAVKAMKRARFQPHSQNPVNQHRSRSPPKKPVGLQQNCVLLESKHMDHQSCMTIPGCHLLQPEAQAQVQKKMKHLIEQRAARLGNSMFSPRRDEALSPLPPSTPAERPAKREGETSVYTDGIEVSPLACSSPIDESFGTGMSSLTAVSLLACNKTTSFPDLLWVDTVPTKQNPTVETRVKEQYTDPVKLLELQFDRKSCLPSIADKDPLLRSGVARLNCFVKPFHQSTMTTVDSKKQRTLITPRTVTPTSRRAIILEECAQSHIPRERIDI